MQEKNKFCDVIREFKIIKSKHYQLKENFEMSSFTYCMGEWRLGIPKMWWRIWM